MDDFVVASQHMIDRAIRRFAERGAHAGPSADEMQTFIIRPETVTLPADITHPVQLYQHFIAYQKAG
jgi:hypothetical protein